MVSGVEAGERERRTGRRKQLDLSAETYLWDKGAGLQLCKEGKASTGDIQGNYTSTPRHT